MTMGRWDSEVYRVYVHADVELAAAWSAKAGSVAIAEAEPAFLQIDYAEEDGQYDFAEPEE